MEEQKKQNKNQNLIKTILIITLSITIIICLCLGYSLKEAKEFKYSYKVDMIDTITTEITFKNKYMDVISYQILLKNTSHEFIEYVIASGSETTENYTKYKKFTYKNTYNQLIDYNTGKVEITITVNAQNLSNTKAYYNETFTCYTKGENNKIRFYNDAKLKNETIFTLNDPSKDKLFTNIIVELDIKTNYMK